MTDNIPPGARVILKLIRETETGRKTAADQYNTVIGHKEGNLPKPLIEHTLDELVAAQRKWPKNWRVASGAAGAYQIIRATLSGLIAELKLPGSLKFTPELQDRLGYHLLKRRGYERFDATTMSLKAFGNELAKEWASFPVLTDTKGAHRDVKRGQSYYAGDGINKALLDAMSVEVTLSEALNENRRKPTDAPKPVPAPTPLPSQSEPVRGGWLALVMAILRAVAGLFRR